MSGITDAVIENDIVNMTNDMNCMYVGEIRPINIDLIDFISQQTIDEKIKQCIIQLICNDNYNDYLSIYNICMENDIELPPLL